MAQKPLAKVNKKNPPQSGASKIWGGRFDAAPSHVMEQINVSIDFDKRLYAQDIAASIAHCDMLVKTNIIASSDGKKIIAGLRQIKGEIESGDFLFRREYEDIHMNIEARLGELIGDTAGRLHTARSRNDQAVTDFRLWVRDAIDELSKSVLDLCRAFVLQAERNYNVVMPGYTHMQSAQPVTFGHHLLAYAEMLQRDHERLIDCRARLNECPLGAAALAGTSFPIDRHKTARDLGFDAPMRNSLDAVSARDFAAEFLSALAIMATHLSRFAEELVIWCNDRFNFIRLPESMTTGSSIMPQKRNPDAAELIRAKAAKIAGNLQSLLMLVKSLPLAYNKDLQEDKPIVFSAYDDIRLAVEAMRAMVDGLTANDLAMRDAADGGFATATDLADHIVQTLRVPFRRAHHMTGELVKLAESKKCGLAQLSEKDLRSVDSRLNKDFLRVLNLDFSVSSRNSYGGTSPQNVKRQAAELKKKLQSGKKAKR